MWRRTAAVPMRARGLGRCSGGAAVLVRSRGETAAGVLLHTPRAPIPGALTTTRRRVHFVKTSVRAYSSPTEKLDHQGIESARQSNGLMAELQQIQAELEQVKQSEQADMVAAQSATIVAKLDQLGKDIKINVVEDEGQRIELPENEDEKKLYNTLKAESLYLCGDALFCVGRQKEALVYLDRVIEMRPNHIDALLARGELYMEMGDDKSAMRDFNEVRFWDPNNPDALFYAASLLRKTMKKISGDKADLDQYFNEVAGARPNDVHRRQDEPDTTNGKQ